VPTSKKLAVGLGLAHFLLVLLMAYSIAFSTDPVAVMAWLYFIAIDFPVSIGWIPISGLIDGNEIIARIDASGNYSTLRDIDNFWLPAMWFATVGSAWWYLIGRIISKTCVAIRETRGT
jgi:hypothetical protein